MAWITLFIAGLFEVAWAISLKHSHGFTQFIPSVITLALMMVSFFLLAHSLKTLPVGTAYAVWTGIGIIGTTILGIVLFGEPASALRILFICLILVGIVGLKVIG
ncbi:MAG TPA: quaternary ammonium compound efflux SMR transporter SugE [Candidatus Aphodousia faecipullorum]|nr:quaternary ammonium compound efflux SMR transporter SugE [Candidatus Aphodousia faecipullorum]